MNETTRKSLGQALGWRAKVGARALARRVAWLARPAAFPRARLAAGSDGAFPFVVHERAVVIARADAGADAALEAGKTLNLALAAPAFDGLLLEPGRPLSFWRTLGPATAARGFQPGIELRGGCVVPAVGGGLCLLSNALFEMAAQLGFAILERHGHSFEAVPPRPGETWGLDATVFHPYVDLRVAPRRGPVRLDVWVAGGSLHVRARAAAPRDLRAVFSSVGERVTGPPGARVRENQIVRRLFAASDGALVSEEIVAVNHRRLVAGAGKGPAAAARARSCTTCGETTCWERRLTPAPNPTTVRALHPSPQRVGRRRASLAGGPPIGGLEPNPAAMAPSLHPSSQRVGRRRASLAGGPPIGGLEPSQGSK